MVLTRKAAQSSIIWEDLEGTHLTKSLMLLKCSRVQ